MLTLQLASYYQVKQSQGAYITAVTQNTPAAKAGLQEKDIIVAVAGQRLGDTMSLFTSLIRHKPGDTVELTVLRGDKELTLKITLAERPANLQ